MLAGQSRISPDDLYTAVRRRVLADVARLQDYTCVQTTTRIVYASDASKPAQRSCEEIIGDRNARKRSLAIFTRERLRLDVAIVDKHEVYSWPGAKQFEDDNIQNLIGYGHAVTGEFGPFLAAIFSENPRMYLGGEKRIGGRRLLEYLYYTPASLSQWEVQAGSARLMTAYGGAVSLDPQTNDLAELTARSAELPGGTGYCEVIGEADYARVRIGGRDALIPQEARSWAVGADGLELYNASSYAGCRAYAAQSTIRYGDEEPSRSSTSPATTRRDAITTIPGGLSFDCRIVTPIDSRSSATGDPVEAVLRSPLTGPGGAVLAPAGARIHGRLVRFVEHVGEEYEVGVQLQSIETGGKSVPFAARLADGGGGPGDFGSFILPGARVQLNHLDSAWVTVAPQR